MSENKPCWQCHQVFSKVELIVLLCLIIITSNQGELKYFSELSK